jgi:hypothetical protein
MLRRLRERGVPRWVMIALITAAVLGFPVAHSE